MRLLFDQNLSRRLPAALADVFPGSAQVLSLGLAEGDDRRIWEYARDNGFAIVSKDSDFQARSLLLGHPPKFIWVRAANCPTREIENLLRAHAIAIHAFEADTIQAHLILP